MSHKKLWLTTTAVVILAITILTARDTPQPSTAPEPPANTSSLTKQMFALLENDPRVRRIPAQRAVQAIATLANSPATDSAEARYALGLLLYYRDRDFAAAETAFQKAITLQPEWSWPHNNLGSALYKLGRKTEARKSFDKAMQLDPTWSRPRNDIAILFREDGQLSLALDQALLAVDMDPKGAVTHYNYGVILDLNGRHSEARAQYQLVIELDPNLPEPHYNLACSYARTGNLNTALPHLKRAIRLQELFRDECKEDPDFDPIRDEPEFKALLKAPPP
jgi:Flp pilus assembly protein TadD